MQVVKRISRANKAHKCDMCGRKIPKRTVYYREKEGVEVEGGLVTWETKWCPKCKHKNDRHKDRFQVFKSKCHHPVTDTHYGYIPGEAVMEPKYDYCRVCGKVL